MPQTTPEVDWDTTVATIEKTVRTLGIDPATVRSQTPGGATVWTLQRGSASVVIFLRRPRENEDAPFVRVIAPIARVPADNPALYKYVLELNARGLSSAAFGLQDDTVVVVSERPARGLDEGEMSFILRTVGTVADHYDDALCNRFGLARAPK